MTAAGACSSTTTGLGDSSTTGAGAGAYQHVSSPDQPHSKRPEASGVRGYVAACSSVQRGMLLSAGPTASSRGGPSYQHVPLEALLQPHENSPVKASRTAG